MSNPPDQSTAPPPPDPPDPPGTDEPFGDFYRRFFPILVAFVMWLGARLPDATDIAQETMTRAFRHWSKIRCPEAWARQVASRELVGRNLARGPEALRPVPPDPPAPPTLTNVDEWEQRHEVLRLLRLLPPRQREVLTWTLNGHTPTEIAEMLNITPEAVRSSLRLARRALARYLNMQGED